jgi:alkylhydroperoxidase family enzyme
MRNISMRNRIGLSAVVLALLAGASRAGDTADATPPTVPVDRAGVKRMIEQSRHRPPRLPLPPPSAAEVAEANQRGPLVPGLPALINNLRMRRLYLPASLTGPNGGFSLGPDPAMTVHSTFKTELFWIVSRSNNCAYCLGHQEAKLAGAGVADARIAALDGDWSGATPAERAAYDFTRTLTTEPHRLGDGALAALTAHHTPTQALEIVLAVSQFNAINRWTGALAIPQEEHGDEAAANVAAPAHDLAPSRVAPLDPYGSTSCARPSLRPPLESPDEVAALLRTCATRVPRLPLADEATARAVLGVPDGEAIPAWARLLAVFPKHGPPRVAARRAVEAQGSLPPLLRARIDWIAARHDRAWYALDLARRRLSALGQTEDQMFAVDRPDERFNAADRAAFAFTRKLTTDPALISDADVAGLRDHFSDREVAELIYRVTEAAFFDRLTEAAGLPLDPDEARSSSTSISSSLARPSTEIGTRP